MRRGLRPPKTLAPVLRKSVERALASTLVAHGKEVDKLEARAANALMGVYRDLAEKLANDLRGVASGDTRRTFQAVHQAQLADQIGGQLEAWAAGSADALTAQTVEALGTGLRQMAKEILTAEQAAELLPGATLERVTTWAPVVPVEAVSYLADSSNLILHNTHSEVATAINASLAESVALGESIAQAVRRMRGSLSDETWRLERIARTEINAAMNHGHQAGLTQASTRFPELGLTKQWSSHRDNHTSLTCLALDGLIVSIEGSFSTEGLTDAAGNTLPPFTNRTPPAHPNCRSRIVAYSARWAGI